MEYTRFIWNNVSIFKNLSSVEQTTTSTELGYVSKKEQEKTQAEKLNGFTNRPLCSMILF